MMNMKGASDTLLVELYYRFNSKHLNGHLKVYPVFNRAIYITWNSVITKKLNVLWTN